MASKKAKVKSTKKRPQRATSNVFAMFDQSQIQEFKEAFNMIDQNRDGFVDKEDLHDMLASLGTKDFWKSCWFEVEVSESGKLVLQAHIPQLSQFAFIFLKSFC